MNTNDRAQVRTCATTDDDPATDNYTRLKETRSLLNQALTAIEAAEHERALASLSAATNRLGERRWPDEHPAGRVLYFADCAHDVAMIHTDEKRRETREAIREAIQLCDAAAEVLNE